MILAVDQQVFDDGADGVLDAGEEADLVLDLMNFGEAASNITGTLSGADPHLIIHQGHSTFADMGTGDHASNMLTPFEVEAAPGAPLGHMAELNLHLDYDEGSADVPVWLLLGRYQYLVWDPTPDQSSGPVIEATLAGLGFVGGYAEALPERNVLDRYLSLWISLGIYSNNTIIGGDSPEASSIEDYVTSGGACYLEGADVWYYDPGLGGYDFAGLFGLNADADGTSDCGPIVGVDGTFTEGMEFSYVGENSYMDHISPGAGAEQILRNGSPSYGAGVSYDSGSYRTVGTIFEFGGLVDGSGVSTKAQLAMGIMNFFLGTGTAVDETPSPGMLAAWPNPFNPKTTIRFSTEQAGPISLDIFDAAGRRVRGLHQGELAAGSHQFSWDGRGDGGETLASGLYFARLKGDRVETSLKLLLLK